MSSDALDHVPAFHFDLVVAVLSKTIFSPVFAVGTTATLYSQHYRSSDAPMQVCLIYTGVCIVLALAYWFERIYRNQLWRRGLSGLLGGYRVDWDEQIVLVTGGRSGLGRQLVDTLAARHVTVIALDKTSFEHESDSVLVCQCDVSDRKQVFAAAERIRQEVGEPTVLINNAGIVVGKPLLELSEEEVQSTLGINLTAHFWTLQAFLPAMKRNKTGHIVRDEMICCAPPLTYGKITIGSILSWAGVEDLTDYCASKSAMLGLLDSLRAELRRTPDIRLTTVYPGHIATPLFIGARIPNPIFRFLLPTVATHTLAKAIIAAIDTHESRDISIPWMAQFAWLDRASPSWLRDFVHWLAGVNEAFTPQARARGSKKEQ